MKNRRALSLMCLQMLESGADRRTVKRALTTRRVKGRQAVVLLCKQEMTLLRAGKLPIQHTLD
ncbi:MULTISPECIES: hypothetical protein [Citrobacter freundii complex]|uniref:hypothetical protein n=1 Tax=Citrobacter freundii complex TaxID=1344959 RepID=UPI000EF1864A|nr:MULTISPECIES: hypothetical protein [Citrobacter]AYL67004.1 hypothetical protein CUC50_13520 [Citrobacter werkmanii]MBJ8369157.1 hypothetical protein [Citrobacter cronae]MBJ8396937.1 hypothetical protein [Citrobacter cronae]MBJ8405675.1 hypothetical protein [Citrobacter cronae]MBJ8411827.1 hypothetical protein [Citrobacter cronae]